MIARIRVVLAGVVFAAAGVLFLAWLLWLLWKRLDEESETRAIEVKETVPVSKPPAVEAEAEPIAGIEEEKEEPQVEPPAPPEPDDLKRIEGIGPKISSVLQAAGISTFARLAATDASQLRQVLEEADPRLVRLADPTTWPQQAKLAAAGDWEALESWLAELKGGRLV